MRKGKVPMTRMRQRTGNVYTGPGVQNPEEHALKAELLRQIAARIEAEGLTQTAAAERLGISQPDVSRMLSGNFRQFSVERLMRFLVTLGQEIEIRVRPAQSSPSKGARITVIAA
jgi:predicted XRE-type DNA-binding protein